MRDLLEAAVLLKWREGWVCLLERDDVGRGALREACGVVNS